MLRSVKDIQGYTIQATDGPLGSAHAFLCSDTTWIIRYLVVDTGPWLFGRRVLLVPAALEQPHGDTKTFPVSLTQEQVKNSPNIDMDYPVSRQQELALHAHYQWMPYWEEHLVTASIPIPSQGLEISEITERYQGDPHLRSTREVIGYYIHARDGNIGHVEDFIVDDATWIVRYMAIDTRNWLPRKRVLVAPQWITQVCWGDSQVHVDLTCKAVQNSPEYNPSDPVNRPYEERLFDYYGRPKYWL
jgi:hypothetical protein